MSFGQIEINIKVVRVRTYDIDNDEGYDFDRAAEYLFGEKLRAELAVSPSASNEYTSDILV